MPGTEDIYSDLRVIGKSIIYTVPNSSGTVLTYNASTKEISTRTNSEFISDMNLMTINTLQFVLERKLSLMFRFPEE